VNDLVEFLRARLDEDEQAARAALPGPWRTDHNFDQGLRIMDGSGLVITWTPSFYERGPADAEHIARHDPARVLAEVEAKRWLIERHYRRRAPNWDRPGHVGYECAQCANEYPCPTLAILVIPYADHADYRAEWKP